MFLYKFFEAVRSLGFGALLGAGLLGTIKLRWPLFFPNIDVQVVMAVGAVLGAGIHRFVEKCFMEMLFYPLGSFAGYYWALAQLYALGGIVSRQQRIQITQELTLRYFLGQSSNQPSRPTLPQRNDVVIPNESKDNKNQKRPSFFADEHNI